MTPRARFLTIIEQEAERFGVCPKAIAGRSCIRTVTPARHAVMYRAANELGWSQARIARFWDMDRTSVLNGIRRHEERSNAA